jgi:hypothetical protein
MPKKSKKKATKKSKKAVAKKNAKKKVVRKSASRSATKKVSAKSARKGSPKPRKTANIQTPPLCTQNFSASNGEQVNFTGIPAGGTQIRQVGGIYPFSPVTGTDSNGKAFTNLPLPPGPPFFVVAVPAINQTYQYDVSTCSQHEGLHSVTVTG